MFNCWREFHTGFHSSCSFSRSHQQYMRVPVPSYPHWHLLLSIFFIQAILVGVKWCLTVVLIYIPWWLMTFTTSSCVYWPFYIFFKETSIQTLYSFQWRHRLGIIRSGSVLSALETHSQVLSVPWLLAWVSPHTVGIWEDCSLLWSILGMLGCSTASSFH